MSKDKNNGNGNKPPTSGIIKFIDDPDEYDQLLDGLSESAANNPDPYDLEKYLDPVGETGGSPSITDYFEPQEVPPTFEEYLKQRDPVGLFPERVEEFRGDYQRLASGVVLTDGEHEVDLSDQAVAQDRAAVVSMADYVSNRPSSNGNGQQDHKQDYLESWRNLYQNPESLDDVYSGDEPRLQPMSFEVDKPILFSSFIRANVLKEIDRLLAILLPPDLQGLTGKELDAALKQAYEYGNLSFEQIQRFADARSVMFTSFARDLSDNLIDVLGITFTMARHRAEKYLVKGSQIEDEVMKENRKTLDERWSKMGKRVFSCVRREK